MAKMAVAINCYKNSACDVPLWLQISEVCSVAFDKNNSYLITLTEGTRYTTNKDGANAILIEWGCTPIP